MTANCIGHDGHGICVWPNRLICQPSIGGRSIQAKSKVMRARFAAVLPAMFVMLGWSAEALTPRVVVELRGSWLQAKLQGRQEYYADNLDQLYDVINDNLLPYFDVRLAGRMVLGKHWRSATADQRDRFIDVFYTFLVRTYAKGMLEFDQYGLTIFADQKPSSEDRAVVKTEWQLDDGTRVPVNYSLRKSSKGWKVYDVRIDGVSYVRNYRSQFNAEISVRGIDAVIVRLENDMPGAATEGEG